MKKLLLFTIFYATTLVTNAQSVQDWTSGLPTLSSYNSHMIATDSQGNVYAVGTYSGAVTDFDSGAGIFNMSAFSNNMYIVKVNALGNFVWAKQIGGATTYAITTATAISIDASDNIYIAGSTDKIIGFGTLDFDPGAGLVDVINPTSQYVMYILKLDSDGNHLWNRQFNNPANTQYDQDKIYALKVDTTGNVYATGCYSGTLDFDPSTAGVANITSVSTTISTEIFILKLNNTGDYVWAKALPNSSGTTSPITDTGNAIDVDSSGNVYTTGYYTFSLDADPSPAVHNLNINPTVNGVQYISKLDVNGNYVWAYDMLGQHNQQFLPSLAVDSSNNVIVTGDTFSVVSTSRDFDFGPGIYSLPSDTGSFVLKINENAGFIWAKSTARTIGVSGSSANYGAGLVVDSSGNIYTCGTFGNNITADFDPSAANYTLTSAGSYDGYISKLDTYGNFVWANKIGGSGLEFCYSLTVSPLGKITVSGSTNTGFSRSIESVSTGGFLASYTQPALANSQFDLDKKVSIFPNPTKDILNIKTNATIKSFEMYDIIGNLVLKQNINIETVDLSILNSGIYFAKIDLENGKIQTQKIIKQ